jgi:hypothetical protein
VCQEVPWYWRVDPGARPIEAFALRSGIYVLAIRLHCQGAVPAFAISSIDVVALLG